MSHFRVLALDGTLLARLPEEGDLQKLLDAFGGAEGLVVENMSGRLTTTKDTRPAPDKTGRQRRGRWRC